MDRPELEVSERTILGKRVKLLRNQGLVPANLYGHNLPSMALQVNARVLGELLRKAGARRLISLRIGPGGRTRPVFIRGLRRNHRTGQILHVDFYQVSMREKIRLHLPVVMVGEAPALKNTAGILVRDMDTIEVEALPGDMPPTIEVEVSGLENIGDSVLVSDLRVPPDVTILANPEEPVVTVAPPMAEEVAEVPAEEAEEVPPTEEGTAE